MIGPFEVSLKIHVTNGEQHATAIYDLPAGSLPTGDDLKHIYESVLKAVRENFGDDWRLSDRHDFENALIQDRTGGLVGEFATKIAWDEE